MKLVTEHCLGEPEALHLAYLSPQCMLKSFLWFMVVRN